MRAADAIQHTTLWLLSLSRLSAALTAGITRLVEVCYVWINSSFLHHTLSIIAEHGAAVDG